VAALSRAQKELGREVIVVAPFYEALITKAHQKDFKIEHLGSIPVELNNGAPENIYSEQADLYRGRFEDGVTFYFVGNKKFFGRSKQLYGRSRENARFYFFNFAALALLKHLALRPSVLHCHDWHAGLIPLLLKSKLRGDSFWSNTATVYTIHNLSYQFGHDWRKVSPRFRDDGHGSLPPFGSIREVERINFAKRGILNADIVNTVSETYREEILTKDFGEDLHRILKNREKIVFGIVNGIDFDSYNPLSDPGLFQHYSDKSVERRIVNKEWLQRHYKLKVRAETPLICMTSRVVEQKGYLLVGEIIEHLLRQDIEVIVMGDGDRDIIQFFEKIQRRYPKHFRVTPYDRTYETSLYAGADFVLLPSRFEPCGINQLIALRYGCIPIVHHIGGFVDTVEDYDPHSGRGNGFVFERYDAHNLLFAVARAVETYKHKEIWSDLIRSGMQEANSWRLPAQRYLELYKTAQRLHRRHA
jgi:starch synthase